VRGTGAEGVHIAGIVNALRGKGISVTLVSPTNTDPTMRLPENGRKHNYISSIMHFLADSLPQPLFEIMEISYNIIAIPHLLKSILFYRPDFIYERYAFFNFSGALISSILNIPFVLEVNELSGHKRVRGQTFVRLASAIERFILNRSSLIITVSDYLNEEISKVLSTNGVVVTIPNGVPQEWLDVQLVNHSTELLRERLKLKNKKVVCFIGGLAHWHNFDFLLEVFHSLHKKVPETVLLIVGDGPMRGHIESKLQEMNINDNSVLMVGNVNHREVPSYISVSDVSIIPETNNFRSPIKMFEYMALGKPVVAPRMPAIEAVIDDEKDGLLFTPGDKNDLENKLSRLLTNHELAQSMGVLAHEKIKDLYTWEKHAEKILSLLMQLPAYSGNDK